MFVRRDREAAEVGDIFARGHPFFDFELHLVIGIDRPRGSSSRGTARFLSLDTGTLYVCGLDIVEESTWWTKAS